MGSFPDCTCSADSVLSGSVKSGFGSATASGSLSCLTSALLASCEVDSDVSEVCGFSSVSSSSSSSSALKKNISIMCRAYCIYLIFPAPD